MFGRKASRHLAPLPTPDESGIHLGRYYDPRTGQLGAELIYKDDRHLLLFGPSGSGKSMRIFAKNLLGLNYCSVIVIDPKAELTAITAAHRRRLGRVVILNPFDVLGLGSDGFNALGHLDPNSKLFFDTVLAIAEALIKIEEKEPHWSESAEALIAALIMWVCIVARREGRTPLLEDVRRLLTEPDEFIRGENGAKRQVKGLRLTAARMCAEGGFEIESLMGRFLRENDEVAGIQSTADRATRWMLSPPMRENMRRNDIDFASLKDGGITTVYVVLPAERMRTHAVWLRLVITTALRSLYRPGGLPVLLMLDEFAQLGHLGVIEDAFGLVRGYGVQLWPVLQDLSQLQSIYKDRWETFAANAGVIHGFGPNDLSTAEWMSRMCGETTIVTRGYNLGDSQNPGGMGHSQGLNFSQSKRRFLLPQEIMEFPAGAGLIWPAGASKSVPFFAPFYWNDATVSGRAQPNPYHTQRRPPGRDAS